MPFEKSFKFACVKQQVRDISTCNFSSWEYMSELNVVMIFYIFPMSEFQREKK